MTHRACRCEQQAWFPDLTASRHKRSSGHNHAHPNNRLDYAGSNNWQTNKAAVVA